jgi:hypothetical protein
MNDKRMDSHLKILPFTLDLFAFNMIIKRVLNLPFLKISHQWDVNLTYLKILPILHRKKFNQPTTRMSSERRKRSFYRHVLVSIWSLPVPPSVVLKPLSAACKPSSAPTALELGLPPKNAVAADVRTCPSSRKLNCLPRFFKWHAKAAHRWWPISIKPTKPLSAKKSRRPLYTACWPDMGGRRRAAIVRSTQVECNCHERCEPIRRPVPQPEFSLGDAWSSPARWRSCRSCRSTFGGDY